MVLETAEGIAAGGSRGGMFSAEAPDAGLLFQALNYSDTDLQMPPDGKLPDDELALLKKWIDAGAVLPEYKANQDQVTRKSTSTLVDNFGRFSRWLRHRCRRFRMHGFAILLMHS